MENVNEGLRSLNLKHPKRGNAMKTFKNVALTVLAALVTSALIAASDQTTRAETGGPFAKVQAKSQLNGKY